MPHLRTNDNIELFYTSGGTGKPIVFVASAWLSSKMWEFQIPYFAHHGFRCVAYDRRGHGRSDEAWDGYDYDTLADDLAAVLTHLDLSEVTLVGHSMGCGEIIRYLTRHGSGRIRRIVLTGSTTPFPKQTDDNPTGINPDYVQADLKVRTADRAKWYADHAASFFGIGLPGVTVSAEQVQFMIQQCLECSARAASQFFLTGFTTDLRKDLQAIRLPALILHGAHDAQAPFSICGQPTAALLSASKLMVYDNAAHGLFLTHAERFNRDVLSFVEETRTNEH